MNFKDERCGWALEKLKLMSDGSKKLMRGEFSKLTDKEMVAMHEVLYLSFDNHYGESVGHIGHLTTFGRREVFENYQEVIKDKLEHFISKAFNY